MITVYLLRSILMTAIAWAGADPSGEVHVFVRGAAQVNLLVLQRAQQQASAMLQSAGIRVVWKSGRPDNTACCHPQVVLEYSVDRTDRSQAPDVMAYAFPYGTGSGGINILYHRIVSKRRRPEKLLAHVIVHEVTHMLQGFGRHADNGIMKAYWTPEDYQQMESAPLAFTADDILFIQIGMAKRIAAASREKASGYNSPVKQVSRP